MIDELELSDIFLSNGLFTWSNGRERPFLSLIDCFLVNIEWMEKFWYSRASILNRITSDHCPIMLVTDNFSWGPMPFCFENMRFLEFFYQEWKNINIQGWLGFVALFSGIQRANRVNSFFFLTANDAKLVLVPSLQNWLQLLKFL